MKKYMPLCAALEILNSQNIEIYNVEGVAVA